MGAGVPLSLGPGHGPVLDVVVDHGGGKALPLPIVDELTGHIGNELVHIQADVGKCLPLHRALTLEALLQLADFLHGRLLLSGFKHDVSKYWCYYITSVFGK